MKQRLGDTQLAEEQARVAAEEDAAIEARGDALRLLDRCLELASEVGCRNSTALDAIRDNDGDDDLYSGDELMTDDDIPEPTKAEQKRIDAAYAYAFRLAGNPIEAELLAATSEQRDAHTQIREDVATLLKMWETGDLTGGEVGPVFARLAVALHLTE